MTTRLPTRLDRYPAKMVSRLADTLVWRYASNATSLLDPFCGSGAVLQAGSRRGIPTTGLDVNPIASLFSQVKLTGFSLDSAIALVEKLVRRAQMSKRIRPIDWDLKSYWFTAGTLEKYERLRAAGASLELEQTMEGMAVLLAYALSVRLCSRADQRSPKPFISKRAIAGRQGKHFDPYRIIPALLIELGGSYGETRDRCCSRFVLADVVSDRTVPSVIGMHSHVITSPPYINAQDYFRNFKLELMLLEGLLPFRVCDLKERFIGTERGDLLASIPPLEIERQRDEVPETRRLAKKSPRAEAILQRYLYDMGNAFDTIQRCLEPKGILVLVCGDNLMAGQRISTWRILGDMLVLRGFRLFDSFSDKIVDRMLAPKRCGHKGLIKEEMVMAFKAGGMGKM